MMNVKGTDLLKIDQKNTRKDELKQIKPIYDLLELEFERFRSDWGKKNEMYTGLIWFKLGLCDRDKV